MYKFSIHSIFRLKLNKLPKVDTRSYLFRLKIVSSLKVLSNPILGVRAENDTRFGSERNSLT